MALRLALVDRCRGGMPWTDKWEELGQEGYIPQVYFYSRQGKPLHVSQCLPPSRRARAATRSLRGAIGRRQVVNAAKEEWNWHSFTSDDALAGTVLNNLAGACTARFVKDATIAGPPSRL